jgi:hypothetical protein
VGQHVLIDCWSKFDSNSLASKKRGLFFTNIYSLTNSCPIETLRYKYKDESKEALDMKLIITKHAFERFRKRASVNKDNFYGFQNQLQKVLGSELCFIEWQGKPAVYFNQSYWRYVSDEKKDEITLVICLGILEFISNSKWSRQDSARNSRASQKIMKTIRRKGKYSESIHIV